MKYKKSITDFWIILVFGVFVFFVLSVIVPRLLGKSSAEASDILSASRDYDGDSIADYYDRCACQSGDGKNDGCPSGIQTTGPAALEREKECKKKIKASYA